MREKMERTFITVCVSSLMNGWAEYFTPMSVCSKTKNGTKERFWCILWKYYSYQLFARAQGTA
jgi:hypothetical protein